MERVLRCEWCKNGYCEEWATAEEQEERETQWLCDGSEDQMIDCGIQLI